MPDSEKVMSWLEGLAEPDWRVFHGDSEVQEIARNALDMLKEQEEEVEPICQIIFDVPYYFCGSCKTMLNMYGNKSKIL